MPVNVPREAASPAARSYVVHRGDTLYSIAFQYDMDYKHLAAINHIPPPYTIYIGERLRLGQAQATAAEQGASEASGRPVAPVIHVPQVADSQIHWRWPYDGMVINGFSLTGKINKGIDILAKPGAKIRASAAGVVVFAGGGLRGYGKLVIIRHNDRFLSAYGGNAKIYVREGQQVKAGQVVSSLGKANGADELLHFEIRRDGKPENPLNYLPKRPGTRN